MERKLTKQELKGPDAFISNMDRFSHWLFENRVTVGIVLSVLAVGSIAWATYGFVNSRKEEAAQEQLFKAEKAMKSADAAFKAPEPPPGEKEEAKKEAKPVATRSGQIDVDYKDVLPVFKDVIAKYPGTQAAVIASIDLASIYHDYKKYDDEVPLLEAAAKWADHPVTQGLTLSSLGLAYEAKGDCNNAVTQWTKIQNNTDLVAFKADAMIKTALCYEKLGQKDKAADLYSRFDSADKQLRQITENTAHSLGIDPNLPMEMQSPDKVKKFQAELSKSSQYQELQALVSDRQAVKAAKKYLKILKRS